MNEYFFGLTTVKPTEEVAERMDEVARKHGGRYVEANRKTGTNLGINHGNYQGWFSIPNRGSPFNQDTSKAILSELSEGEK